MHQLKLALRQLRLRPGLSLVVILMLALGIGATTAMFSLYHQLLVRPLPVPAPDRLVNLAAPGPKPGNNVLDLGLGDDAAKFSYPMFRDLQRRQTVFTDIAAHTNFMANVSYGEQGAFELSWLVSGGYFRVLGLTPALGRLIGPEDEPQPGESAVAVLSYDAWQRRFGGSARALGETVTINGHKLEIVGVAPQGFTGTTLGQRPEVFVPLTMANFLLPTFSDFEGRQTYWVYLFARLKAGVTLERARAELNGLYSGILNDVEAPMLSGQDLPEGTLDGFRARKVEVTSGARGQSTLRRSVARPVELLLGVTVLVLAIVCVNIANLLLARGAARGGEMALRTSMGASRGVLVRQLLAESLVLIAIGGVASLAVAALLVRVVASLLTQDLASGLAPELSGAAMLFAAGASLATVLVFGLVPAWRVSDADPAQVMRASTARSAGGRGAARFRSVLTTAQIAFSMVLLVLAGLFSRSLMNVARQDLGMDVDSVVVFSITPRLNGYSRERIADLYDRVEDSLAAQPGVRAVGGSALPLLSNFALHQPMAVEGFDTVPGADTTAEFGIVGPGFFEALGIPRLKGRAFTDQDKPGKPPVAIVNVSFARRFKLANAVGAHFGFGTTTTYPFEIVGVVGDVKQDSVKGDSPPMIYLSRRQAADSIQAMFYYVRTGVDPETLLRAIPRIVADIDPDVPVSQLQTMAGVVNNNVYLDRLLSMLSGGFAALATLLAGIGLYGVLAYNVTQRTRELGLRLALGAAPARLRAMVLKQVGTMAAVGAATGLAAALLLGRVAESVLFGLSGRDPLVLAAATTVLAAVVLAGSWWPARRASRIAPTEALRYE